jgi:hypothetical protein
VRALVLFGCALTLLACLLPAPSDGARPSERERCPQARKAVVFWRATADGWRARHDAGRHPTRNAETAVSCAYVRWASKRWRTRSRVARRDFGRWFRAVYAKWSCIHAHEGSWSDPGAPHWGGLQMDMGFQATYGAEFLRRWGTADRWPVWAQLLAAERAFHGYGGYGPRGFGPWPWTARACGLL